METTEEIISKSVECCSEFLCSECPYNEYEDSHYTLKCIHMLMKDINELFKSKRDQVNNGSIDEKDGIKKRRVI